MCSRDYGNATGHSKPIVSEDRSCLFGVGHADCRMVHNRQDAEYAGRGAKNQPGARGGRRRPGPYGRLGPDVLNPLNPKIVGAIKDFYGETFNNPCRGEGRPTENGPVQLGTTESFSKLLEAVRAHRDLREREKAKEREAVGGNLRVDSGDGETRIK